ncbi:hypothetical protein PR202_ga06253 [Eleusine coracana subsp. coracana]|uniref:Uncharacterized protein n=1 Tax=Eleusine coracana subsp. coracana TaxID=191504 RepID=A0AAV5BUC8_ELECO|nr:hypothetical protein PR202_ga06253 [Eleusine coracana subsp. coracana]
MQVESQGVLRENLATMKYLKKMHSRVIFMGRLSRVVRGIGTTGAAFFSVKLYMQSRGQGREAEDDRAATTEGGSS